MERWDISWSRDIHLVPDGRKYVGEYKDGINMDMVQGTGTLPDGSKYVGEFKDGERTWSRNWNFI